MTCRPGQPRCCRHCRRRHRRQCALLQLVWVPSLCTASQCRRIAENLRSFCRGSCVHYTNTTGIFRYVPCLGCLVQLVVLTAYLKAGPSMHWPMIIRQYNEVLTISNSFGQSKIAARIFYISKQGVLCLKNLHVWAPTALVYGEE